MVTPATSTAALRVVTLNGPAKSVETAAPEYLDVRGAATLTGLSKSLFDKMRMKGEGPPVVRIGRRALYGREALRRWMESRRA